MQCFDCVIVWDDSLNEGKVRLVFKYVDPLHLYINHINKAQYQYSKIHAARTDALTPLPPQFLNYLFHLSPSTFHHPPFSLSPFTFHHCQGGKRVVCPIIGRRENLMSGLVTKNHILFSAHECVSELFRSDPAFKVR